MSISAIENLSNECFYDIFDYLHDNEIYKAFSNLNYRFQQLLNSSSLLIKIKADLRSDELSRNVYNQIIHMNRNQIFSFHLSFSRHMNPLFSSFTFDSSFSRLESIIIGNIESTTLISFLMNLGCLPRLFSLTIYQNTDFKELNDIYRLIFNLNKLKYFKYSSYEDDRSISLPMITNEQFSPIEHLVIDHSCTLNELACILSYVPQLRRLSFTDRHYDDSNINNHFSSILSNLTHLTINVYDMKFDKLEMFIKNMNSKLNFLHVNITSEDVNYLNSDRWENFILKYLSKLDKFYFDYCEDMEGAEELSTHLKESNQFNSLFWIERKWILEIKVDFEFIIYSIRPYKKRWYEYVQHPIINSSLQLSKSARLNFPYIPPCDCPESLIMIVNSVLTVTEIYHLDISKISIFVGLLIYLIEALPELVTLKLHTLILSQERNLCEEEIDMFLLVSDTNKITKVYLEKMIGIEEVDILIKLCPRMNYLQINNINNMDVEIFLKEILIEMIGNFDHHLRCLCFRILTADDQMVQKLKKMIDNEKLLIDYTIKRVYDNIHLQWR